MNDSTPWPTKAAFLADHLDERLAARFWKKVLKTDDCWLWLGARDRRGYGYFSVGPAATRRTFCAHRIAVALNGRIPGDDQMVCHHCDNPQCVRPDHLFLGTHSDNMQDMHAKGRGRKASDMCARGHSLTDETNVYRYDYGSYIQRACITCHRERYHAARQARGEGDAA